MSAAAWAHPLESERRIVVRRVLGEMDHQDRKWAVQNQGLRTWLVVLMEEVGEACQACLEDKPLDVEAELIQVAAVAIQACATVKANVRNE